MPENKRQHYVPKFYLRLFGHDDGASIGVFNIARGKLIRSASLKTQAYRDWFYGHDLRVERTFTAIEGKAAQVISRMAATRTVPRRFSEEHNALVVHVQLQHSRTEAAEAVMNEQADKVARMMLSHSIKDPELLAALPNVEISLTNAVAESIRFGLLSAPMLFDLKYKLIENRSPTAFLTSDAPVVFHNHWLHGLDRNTGIATKGLQVLLPLGPRLAILFYDEAVYDVGKPTSNVVALVNPAHASRINDLQWESARANLYVSTETGESELVADLTRTAGLRHAEQVEFVTDVVYETDTRQRMALTVGRSPSTVDLRLPFIRLLEPRRTTIGRFEVVDVRSPEHVATVRMAIDALEAGDISMGEYLIATSRVPTVRRRHR